MLTSCCIDCVLYTRDLIQAFVFVNVAYLMLATRRNTSQLYDVCMLDCRHSLHDLIHGLCSLHNKQLVTGVKGCRGVVLQSAETRLRDMQALVQQEAGVLLDRQRITIEGMSSLPEVRDSEKAAKSLKAHKDIAVCISIHGVTPQHSFFSSLVQSWKYYPWTNMHKLTYVL